MKFLDLRNNCFLEVIEYLTFSEIASLRKICKFFQTLLSRNHAFIQTLFQKRNCINDSKSLKNWDQICKEIKTVTESTAQDLTATDSTVSNRFWPFYTDGGTIEDLYEYFIQNLVIGGVYCTTVKNNALIKYIFTFGKTMSNYDPFEHKVSDTVFIIKDIERSIYCERDSLPLIHSIRITSPEAGFNCPVCTLMVFSSVENDADLEMIKLFHNTFDVTQVVQIATSLKLNPIVEISNDRIKVTFDRKETGLAPLMWIKLNSLTSRQSHTFFEEIQRSRFARYFYLLLIEGENCGDNANIDCGDVRPAFKLIRIRD